MQRRVSKWKALHGPEKEIVFRQLHEPGHQCLSDFTVLKGINITIKGQVFQHILYHFRLAYSNWSFMKIIQGGESFTALSQSLQDALWKLGGCPREHRTDSLSAAFKNLYSNSEEDITKSYEAICIHYGMIATRNNRGKGHEHGSVEAAHGHLKRRLEQALLLRGSYDFKSVEEYQDFIDVIVQKHNNRHEAQLNIE
ncbi:IS21 family transposase [Rickettsia endosymbiont of Gonocerus acuteangulatus]